jgi:hypothetical protein
MTPLLTRALTSRWRSDKVRGHPKRERHFKPLEDQSMAIYLYNLGFSASNYLNGNFNSGGSGANASDTWFQYTGTGTPTGQYVYQGMVTTLGQLSNWTALDSIPSNFNSTENPAGGDYVFLRIFNADGNPSNFIVRTTAIFGQGGSDDSPADSPIQSPFICNANDQAVPVFDCDTVLFAPGGAPSWPAAFTDNNSWTYCLGQVNGPTNDYVLNVGASVYVVSGAGQGSIYLYGIDPKMHVSGVGMGVSKDEAA